MTVASRLTTAERSGVRALERSLTHAANYADWLRLAREHDALSGAQEWRAEEDNQLFDATDIRRRRDRLERATRVRDVEELLFALNEGIHGNISGMGNPKLYSVAKAGTKTLIEDYISAINDALELIADAGEETVPFAEKLDFFRRASLCYGRSALTLSGGGGLIYFHHGVVEALLEQQLLPSVLSGSSAGSWVCAQLGTRTDAELEDYFVRKRYQVDDRAIAAEMMFPRGPAADPGLVTRQLESTIESSVENMTFAEAFEQSGRHINISIASADRHHRARLLNAITSPNVTLRSACRASSSLPHAIEPAVLEAKNRQGQVIPYLPTQRWIDGAFSEDLPMKRLARLYGANHFIVSQINALSVIAPFIRPERKSGNDGLLHQSSQMWFLGMKQTSRILQTLLPFIPDVFGSSLATFRELIDQDFSGDVTISARFHKGTMNQFMFNYVDDQEIVSRIEEGRQATWPRMEQIRNATTVSRTLDRILAQLELEAGMRPAGTPGALAAQAH